MTNEQKTKLLKFISLHVDDQIDQAFIDYCDYNQIMSIDQYEQIVSEKNHRAKLDSEIDLLEFIDSL